MKKGDRVLVMAAAGGTGQFAIQLAKLARCHMIDTCSKRSTSPLYRTDQIQEGEPEASVA